MELQSISKEQVIQLLKIVIIILIFLLFKCVLHVHVHHPGLQVDFGHRNIFYAGFSKIILHTL